MPDAAHFNRIMIGVPCYGSAPAETLEDYMRFAYHLGRRYRDYDFFSAVIPKQEQFRARNAIIEAAIQINAKYLLMLDDDMVVNTEQTVRPSACYDFLKKMIEHIERDPSIGIQGALYYQRGGSYHPVAMYKKHNEYFWMRDEDIQGKQQEVTVTGGGCLLFNMKIFDSVASPWFEPEQQTNGPSRGTDIQICEKARAAGYKVMIDTSIELGHVKNERNIITGKTRMARLGEQSRITAAVQQEWDNAGMITLYSMDVEEYTGKSTVELEKQADAYAQYRALNLPVYLFNDKKDMRDYYRGAGETQLARQYVFHRDPSYGTHTWLSALRDMCGKNKRYGLDFGCGSSPLGFQLALDGNKMDFVDLDGAGAYEFVKWRAKKRNLNGSAGFELAGPYDFILLMDVIEHLPNWEEAVREVVGKLKPGGMLATNYFVMTDEANPEHIMMDKKAVKRLLVDLDMVPGNQMFWRKEFTGHA